MASLSWFEEALFIVDKMRPSGMSGGMLHLSCGNYRGETAKARTAQSHVDTTESAVGSKDRQTSALPDCASRDQSEVVSLRKSLTFNKNTEGSRARSDLQEHRWQKERSVKAPNLDFLQLKAAHPVSKWNFYCHFNQIKLTSEILTSLWRKLSTSRSSLMSLLENTYICKNMNLLLRQCEMYK